MSLNTEVVRRAYEINLLRYTCFYGKNITDES